MTPEKQLISMLRKNIDTTSINAWHFKSHGGGMPADYQSKIYSAQDVGLPDLICCINGIFIGIECKIYPREFTTHQCSTLRKIIIAGGVGIGVVLFEQKIMLLTLSQILQYRSGKKKDTCNNGYSICKSPNDTMLLACITLEYAASKEKIKEIGFENYDQYIKNTFPLYEKRLKLNNPQKEGAAT